MKEVVVNLNVKSFSIVSVENSLFRLKISYSIFIQFLGELENMSTVMGSKDEATKSLLEKVASYEDGMNSQNEHLSLVQSQLDDKQGTCDIFMLVNV